MRDHIRKKSYNSPTIDYLGPIERVTMGHGGSSWDGTCTFTQRGKGNDAYGPAVGHGGPPAHSNGNGGGPNNGCGN